MQFTSRFFYQFSGFHSVLIGLLPFFLPILLWEQGATLAQISGFIAITGIGFIGTLWCWDRLRFQQRWRSITVLSFIIELLLIGTLFEGNNTVFLAGLALINGAYNCFYWSTQRAIFSQITSDKNTGRTFGNFQILVVILLKMGILTGGYLLESHGLLSILLLSMFISVIAIVQLMSSAQFFNLKTNTTNASTKEEKPVSLGQTTRFEDSNKSKLAFLLDGPFLFLESYFWVLSLYFFVGNNIFDLSIVIVALTLLLSVTFYFIKNKIDQINPQRLFNLAVVLYALSWLLRGQLSSSTSDLALYPMIITIAFLTTFFRLAFNKRFFDVAKQNKPYQYLIFKSYYSQLGIALFFGVISLLLTFSSELNVEQHLITVYWFACPLALLYIFYANDSLTLLTKQKLSNRSFRLLNKW